MASKTIISNVGWAEQREAQHPARTAMEALDEDISVVGHLSGKPSGESQASFRQWLEHRAAAKVL